MTSKLVISDKDPQSLLTVEEAIDEMVLSLAGLKDLVKQTNFKNDADVDNYLNNVVHAKCFYERAEEILLDKT